MKRAIICVYEKASLEGAYYATMTQQHTMKASIPAMPATVHQHVSLVSAPPCWRVPTHLGLLVVLRLDAGEGRHGYIPN